MPTVVVPDPVDARLLALIAEAGRAPVHTVAARLGMDVREVAARLAALAAAGLPLVVGVECDPHGIRAALAGAGWGQQAQGTPSGAYPVQGTPSGAYGVQGTPSNAYPVQGTPSGPYQSWGGQPPNQPPAGYPNQPPAGLYPGAQQPGPPPPQPGPQYPGQPGPPSGGFPAQGYPNPGAGGGFGVQQPQQQFGQQQQAPNPQSTWGPAQSAAWVRGDHAPGSNRPQPQAAPSGSVRTGTIGSTLDAEGLEGERLTIQLLEVVDPADFLFSAAGYRLQEGERAVVVHTELTNRGSIPFAALPDMYLVLVTKNGSTVNKAPVALSSRPAHRIGIQPGETTGGHTVYVLPESLDLAEVRWSPRPDDEKRTLSWSTLDN